jgi:undecaprenyl-diphosphatase
MEHFALNHLMLHTFYIGTHPATWQLILGTIAAKYTIYLFPAFLVYQFIAHKERRALVLVSVIATMAAMGLDILCNHLWLVKRPFADGLVQSHLLHVANNSFPSTHAAFTSVIAFCFLYQKPRWIGCVLLALALFVGWGRISMGLHYPLDVVTSIALSVIIAVICMKLFYQPITRCYSKIYKLMQFRY